MQCAVWSGAWLFTVHCHSMSVSHQVYVEGSKSHPDIDSQGSVSRVSASLDLSLVASYHSPHDHGHSSMQTFRVRTQVTVAVACDRITSDSQEPKGLSARMTTKHQVCAEIRHSQSVSCNMFIGTSQVFFLDITRGNSSSA